MRWTGMPMAMWALFAKSFEKQLTEVLGYDAKTAISNPKNRQAEVQRNHRKIAGV